MNNNFLKSALSASTIASQVLLTDGLVELATNDVLTGCSIRHIAGSNTVNIDKAGLYLVTFNANFTPTAAGDVTFQLLNNNVVVNGATATVTGATGDNYNVAFTKLVRVLPSCYAIDNDANLQVQASAGATVLNANINIVKLA